MEQNDKGGATHVQKDHTQTVLYINIVGKKEHKGALCEVYNLM